MTHPFHPLREREFALVTFRQNWGQDRVYFHDDLGRLTSIPAEWTDVLPSDPFVVMAKGETAFRAADLLELASLLAGIRQGRGENDDPAM